MEIKADYIKGLGIKNGDVIILSYWNGQKPSPKEMKHIRDHFNACGYEKSLLMFIDKKADIQHLDEKRMNDLGWYRS